LIIKREQERQAEREEKVATRLMRRRAKRI
jgi:hypothetical protein